ncbi:response regulator [Stenotrophomonas sp. CFBP8994]|uniref:response regulator n=1 Tax=Stenotrophomonas sp. CFBP8994 TaxID=3096527 RepID=UPI002A6ADD9A|nr:response regulator [Stenotrophomonas sp. CFBP8994]
MEKRKAREGGLMADGLGGVSVFLVEDEPSLMYVLEESIKSLGYAVGEKAEYLPEALERAKSIAFDVAMLDVNLHGQESFPVADVLVERGIPFIFTTGFGKTALPERFKRAPVMEKPFRLKDIHRAITELQEKLSA